MFKDVVKKWGAKVAIAACSVVLLGGVAVAAPHLRAADTSGKMTYAEAKNTAGFAITAADMVYQIDPKKVADYAVDGVIDGKSVGKTQLPELLTLSVTTSGGAIKTEELALGQHFHYVNQYASSTYSGNYNVGKQSAMIEIDHSEYIASGETSIPITYEIKKANVYKYTDKTPTVALRQGSSASGDTYYMNDSTHTFSQSELQVGIILKAYNDSDGSYPETILYLPNDEFEPPTKTITTGTFDFAVTLNNFTTGANDASNVNGNCKILKNVESLQVFIKDTDGTEVSPKDYQGTMGIEPTVIVRDNGTDVTSQVSVVVNDVNTREPYITVQGDGTSTCVYGGGPKVVKYTNASVELSAKLSGHHVIEYNTDSWTNGYEVPLSTLLNWGIVGPNDTALTRADIDVSKYEFVKLVNGRYEVQSGATAGRVRVELTGKGKYNGDVAELTYYVSRSLEKAEITFDPSTINDTYDRQPGHVPTSINVSYEDNTDYKLWSKDKGGDSLADYSLTYIHVDDSDQSPTDAGEQGNTTDAGSVYIQAEGTGQSAADNPQGNGGYYGKTVLREKYSYQIKPLNVNDAGYELYLNRRSGSNASEFQYTGSAAPVKENAYIRTTKGGMSGNETISIKDLQEGVDYRIIIKDSDGNTVPEAVERGEYEITYKFMGNYEGDLTTKFSIVVDLLSDCNIYVESPLEYTGDTIDAQVKITSDRSGQDVTNAFKIIYADGADRVNAGTVNFTIQSLDGSDKQSRSFVIAPYDLSKTLDDGTPRDSAAILPESEYELANGNTSGTHVYVGRDNYPELPEVTLANGMVLTKDTDYTIVGLYTGAAKVTKATYPNTSADYYYIIEGIGNYENTTQTIPFTLLPATLDEGSIVAAIPDKNKTDERTTVKYIEDRLKENKYVEWVQSGQTIENLIFNTDYEVRREDDGTTIKCEDNYGVVTFWIKGKGCYESTNWIPVTFNVGESILKAVIHENRQTVPDENGVRTLRKSYSPSGNVYNMVFAKDESDKYDSGKIYLTYPGDGNKEIVLLEDTDYTVDYGDIVYENDGIGDKYCTVKFQAKPNGKYYGVLEARFKVVQKEIDGVTVEVIYPTDVKVTDDNGDDAFEYSGLPWTPLVKVTDADGTTVLTLGEDYILAWDNNINANERQGDQKAKVIVTGVNEYTGTKTVPFNIARYGLGGSRVNIKNLKQEYTYEPGTAQKPGVRPDVTLTFTTDTNVTTPISSDVYDITYNHNTRAWGPNSNRHNLADQPSIVITAKKYAQNFKDSVERTFDIAPINLADPDQVEIEFTGASGDHPLFTGKKLEPEYTVWLKLEDGTKRALRNGKQEPDDPSATYDEYVPTWDDNQFVRQAKQTPATLTIKATNDGNCINECIQKFYVTGDLSQRSQDAKDNSEISPISNRVDFREDGNYSKAEFLDSMSFRQKKHKDDDPTSQFEERPMYWSANADETDYEISINNNIIGEQEANVKGLNDFINNITVTVNIVGDLKEATYTEPPVLAYDGSATPTTSPAHTSIRLEDVIAPVTCGNKILIYGEDYEFVGGDPDNSIGTHTAVIQPTETGKKYLKNTLSIDYEIKQSIANFTFTGLRDDRTYPYDHGNTVLAETEIKVKDENGKTLVYGQDYTVEFTDGAVDSGYHAVTIKGIGNYSGVIDDGFTITKCNLKTLYENTPELITIKYDEKSTYTGRVIIPEVKSITVVKSRNGTKVLSKPTEDDPEYTVTEGNNDKRNYTKEGDTKPTFYIVGTGRNYEGTIELEFEILRKNIEEEDVTFDPIADQPYNNGNDILPKPRGMYNNIELVGQRILSQGDTVEGNPDYTYQYGADTKNVGNDRKITIVGYGNFTGTRTLEYNVTPKSLTDTDVTLKETIKAVTYDGQVKHPAFTLMYAGEPILEYSGTGTNATSRYMDGTNIISWDDDKNTNATESAEIVITPKDGDNYIGPLTLTFTILPASIDNKVSIMYYNDANEPLDLSNPSNKMELPYTGATVTPDYVESVKDTRKRVGVFYKDETSLLNGTLLLHDADKDYTVTYEYIEPDSEDTPARKEYENQSPERSYAGKVKATIKGVGNYTGTAVYTFFIGEDISNAATCSISPTTTVYNTKSQPPKITVTCDGAYRIVNYRHDTNPANIISTKDMNADTDITDKNNYFVDADTYYVRVEGVPSGGTYASSPVQMTYTITSRPLSNRILIEGFQKEYNYRAKAIQPVGLAVTDYIDDVKYRLTEGEDYTLGYANNVNVGTATITVTGTGNFQGSATAKFTITSSTITSNNNEPGANASTGTGQISAGNTVVTPDDVQLTLNAGDAMYYTGSELRPNVTISGMTQNTSYVVSYSNNVNVGTATVTVTGIGNNSGTITKTFRIIADLKQCKILPIPAQEYTGSEIKPNVTVMCGSQILIPNDDYTVTYTNNVNVGTATVTVRAANNPNYLGTTSANFTIGVGVVNTTTTYDANGNPIATTTNNGSASGPYTVTGYASEYVYTGNAITPNIVVKSGSTTLTPGTDYVLTYSNNTNVGTATITISGRGKYAGTSQIVNFTIAAKNIQSGITSTVDNKTYTGDAYTPAVTVTDGGKTLTNGVDYTVTYTNNTNPGTADILIQGMNNYAGTKVVSFKISGVAVKNLKASSITNNSVKLSWSAQDYADGYQVCDSKSKVVKTVAGTSTKITGLSAGKTYKYKVRSYINNTDGSKSYGGFSSVVSATTKLKTPSAKITSTKAGQAKISWSKVSGANGYQIYYKKASKNASYKKLKTINSTTVRNCTIKGMKSGDRYYFRVRAFKNNGSSKIYSSFNPAKVITIK